MVGTKGEMVGRQDGDQSVNRTSTEFDPFYNVDPQARAFFIQNPPPEQVGRRLDPRRYGQFPIVTDKEVVSAGKLSREELIELAEILPDNRPDLRVNLDNVVGGRIPFAIGAVRKGKVDDLFHPDNREYTADQLKKAVRITLKAWESRGQAPDLFKLFNMIKRTIVL